jgi:hypothetical protein
LIDKALSRGGNDNTTVVTVSFGGKKRKRYGFVEKIATLLNGFLEAKKGD